MTDIEAKALALLNEVLSERVDWQMTGSRADNASIEALCRALEAHEAFKQKVSDELQLWGVRADSGVKFSRLVIPKPKPDPLEQVLKNMDAVMERLEAWRAALEARGLKIVEKNDD
jgi:hypothetical protein